MFILKNFKHLIVNSPIKLRVENHFKEGWYRVYYIKEDNSLNTFIGQKEGIYMSIEGLDKKDKDEFVHFLKTRNFEHKLLLSEATPFEQTYYDILIPLRLCKFKEQ